MKKITQLFILFYLFISNPLYSQNVSTLVFDETKRFEAMHWLDDGRIYAVDYNNGRLYQIHLDGTVETVLSGFSALSGGGFDADGNFYIAGINTGDMFKLNLDNSIDTVASGFAQPVGLLQDSSNDDLFYVTEWQTSKVSTFSLSTGTVDTFANGNGIFGPDAIIYDWNGNILVSNWNNHKIHRIDGEGNVSLFSNISVGGNMGYITIVGEYIFVPSVTGRKIYRVDMEGNYVAIAGSGSTGYNDGPADQSTFTGPNGICHNPAGDTLLVGDRNSIRVITQFEDLVGISENVSESTFSLSPNPAVDFLNINWNNPELNTFNQWQILTFDGKVIKSGSRRNKTNQSEKDRMDISFLAEGMYVLRFVNKKGETMKKNFIKE